MALKQHVLQLVQALAYVSIHSRETRGDASSPSQHNISTLYVICTNEMLWPVACFFGTYVDWCPHVPLRLFIYWCLIDVMSI